MSRYRSPSHESFFFGPHAGRRDARRRDAAQRRHVRRFLAKRLTLYRQTSERLGVKQRALIDGDMQQLEAVDADLQALDAQIAALEAERRAELNQSGENSHTPLSQTLAQLPRTKRDP